MNTIRPFQLMFLGTGSDVGKSVLAAGFCRILFQKGLSVAPFKAQNMALNSFVTMDGKEMGRAQVIQAYAAGVMPHSDMNPILLKPSGGNVTQIIVQGEPFKNSDARSYYRDIHVLKEKVMESYKRLANSYRAIVLEGAGSTAEMNLKARDVVNISMAMRVGAPAIIVADIDRGGVFASLIGTMRLLSQREKRLIIGFIVNKFRGSRELFNDGIKIIEKKTHRPVFGVVPYFRNIQIPEEDSVALSRGKKGIHRMGSSVHIAVIYLPLISNYTDFDPFEIEKGVSLWYARTPDEIADADIVIIPGTKNTITDLLWLKTQRFISAIQHHVARGKTLIGICGGYQMLGSAVKDPAGVESQQRQVKGLGYLPVETVMGESKTLTRVKAVCNLKTITKYAKQKIIVAGYEIHMGVTKSAATLSPPFMVYEQNSMSCQHDDGAATADERVWGTYLHGIFENDLFRTFLLAQHGRHTKQYLHYKSFLDMQYDNLAALIKENVDVDTILHLAEKYRSKKRGFH